MAFKVFKVDVPRVGTHTHINDSSGEAGPSAAASGTALQPGNGDNPPIVLPSVVGTRVEALLNYQFQNPGLLDQALTKPGNQSVNYERLEFLGDAVLGNLT